MTHNKVILIGGNHHNGLGLARSFGRHGIRPYGIITDRDTNKKNCFVAASRFWEKTWLVEKEEDALEILLASFTDEPSRPVVIAWSDGAAEMIDSNYDRLKDRYILPSMNRKQGEIVRLMNKEDQIGYAGQYGLSMLPSEIVMLDTDTDCPIPFPVILKPVTSIEGGKYDMSICHCGSDYESAVSALREKGFYRILAQKYLADRREYVVTGAVSGAGYSFTVVRHIRQWPLNVGTGSFSETVFDANINDFCSALLEKIQGSGYEGTIDFELFETGSGELYLNEINWRSSGRNFISGRSGIESAYYYYCDMTGTEYAAYDGIVKHIYSMNEVTDIKHVFKKNISLAQWLADVRRAKSFAVWDASDKKPAFKRYGIMLSKFLKGAEKI